MTAAKQAKTKYDRYIHDIQTGAIPANKWVKLAIDRHVNDLKRVGDADFPYYFDADAAARVIDFFHLLPYTAGEWAKKRMLITLEDWQCFFLASIVGWQSNKGGRRFSRAYIEITKKNGKTELGAGLMAYTAIDGGGKDGGQIYSAATKKDQAKLSFIAAQKMCRHLVSEGYQWASQLRVMQNVITYGDARMMAVSSDKDGIEGVNPTFALIDEYHVHPTSELKDNLESATVAQLSAMLLIITTAGSSINGPCYQERETATKILQGIINDERFFSLIYGLDEGDDFNDQSLWKKAIPNLDVSVYKDNIESALQRALQEGAVKRADVLTKHFGIWQNSASTWIPDEKYQSCAASFDMSDMEGRDCYAGVDFAAVNDFNAVSFFFPARHHMEKPRLYRIIWLTEESAKARHAKNPSFVNWEDEGHVIITPGDVADYDRMYADIIEASNFFNIKTMGFDRAYAAYLIPKLVDYGMECVAFQQNLMAISPPTKEIERLILSGEIEHDGNPCLRWMYSNVELYRDNNDNYRPIKGKSKEKKIDGVIADIIAVGIWKNAMAQPIIRSSYIDG